MARELDLGGSERQMALIAQALDRSRFEPIVGCFRPGGVRAQELRAAGIRIAHFPVYSFASPRAATGAWKLARFIRRRQIRLVHTFDYPLTVFAIPVTRLCTTALAVSSQRSHRELIPAKYLSLIRMTDRQADAVVVNCEFIRRHLEQDEAVAARRIKLCYNGIDLDEFCPRAGVNLPAGLPSGALVIGVVCAPRPEKNLQILLEAFARIQGAQASLKLVIVGSGPELPALEARAGVLGIGPNCIFAPATGRVADWLRAMDIFVLPSRTEALSNSLMEAMACGCCAIASNVGGNPELVQNGETGLLFETGDVAGLTAALELLIANQPLRSRLAAAGMKRVRERFSIRASAERMGAIYADLIERRAGLRRAAAG